MDKGHRLEKNPLYRIGEFEVTGFEDLVKSVRGFITQNRINCRMWFVVFGVLLFLVWIGYVFFPNITGFGEYTPSAPNTERAKTLWDFLVLLVIPIVLSLGAWKIKETEREIGLKIKETERTIAADKQYNAMLDTYLDRMAELLLKKESEGPHANENIEKIARTRTRVILRRLDGERNAHVVRLLSESEIIPLSDLLFEGIDLQKADLEGINFVDAALTRAKLQGANLHGAKMLKANLQGANLQGANLQGADLRKTKMGESNLREANLQAAKMQEAEMQEAKMCQSVMEKANLRSAKMQKADLSESNLRGAIMVGADLRNANLRGADVKGTDFQWADLRGANLQDVKNLDKNQLGSAWIDDAQFSEGMTPERSLELPPPETGQDIVLR
jgi:uncharacterized protein YjbI with pentapeptide repeats